MVVAGQPLDRHRLEITGSAADQVGPELGPKISGDFDVTMAELLRQAERLHGGDLDGVLDQTR